MNIDYSFIKPNLDNYLSVLLGLGNTSSNYIVTYDRAMELTKGLEDVIIKLGNDPFMNGTYVCPWSNLGQELNEEKNGPLYTNLRMYDYKYSKQGVWHIVYIVDNKKENVCFTKLYGNGYNTGKRLIYPNGKPILECLHWMLRLGCMDESQVETAMQYWLL